MQIQHKETDGGVFYIEEDNKCVANLEYINNPEDTMTITHTMVAKKLEGQGIGQSLVEAAVKFAREKNLKIKPVCPFALAIMRKNKDYAELIVN